VDEEEYLLQSIVKMSARLATIQGTRGNANSFHERRSFSSPCVRFFLLGEAGKLLPHMLQFTDEHREEGKVLQAGLVAFQKELSETIEEVWTRPPGSDTKDVAATNGAQDATGVNLPPDVDEVAKPQDPLDKIARPQIVEPTWRVALWDRK